MSQISKRKAAPLAKPAKRDLLALALEGLSPNTLRAYASDWTAFARHCGKQPKPFFEAYLSLLQLDRTEATILLHQYRDALKKKKRAAKTIQRRIGGVRAVIARLQQLDPGRFPPPPMCKTPKAKSYRDVAGPSPEQWATLMGELDTAIAEEGVAKPTIARHKRDRALLRLLRDGALRRSEAVTLRVPEHLRAKGTGGSWRLEVRVLGKGDQSDDQRVWVPIGQVASRALNAWLKARGDEPGWLFPGRDPERHMAAGTVWFVAQRWGERAGIDLHPHALRHAGITAAAQRYTGPVVALSRYARHLDPRTTLLYVDNVAGEEAKIADLVGEDDG